MKSGGFPRTSAGVVTAAVTVALAFAPSTQADVGTPGVGVGLGGLQVQVPGVTVPVPGVDVQVPDVGVQVGPDGDGTGDQTVTEDPGTGTGTGTTPDPPAADPGQSDPPSNDPGTTQPTDPGTSGTGTPSTGGDASDSGSNPGGGNSGAGNGGNADNGPAASGPQDAGKGNGKKQGANARSNQNASKDDQGGKGLSTKAGDLIAKIPSSLLIPLVLVAIFALLMTGRSAWFSRATRKLRIQRRSLQDDVGVLSAALVPDLPDSVGGAAIDVAYKPAGGPAAGGDFYDVFELGDGRIGMVVGDISGHGREAVPKTGIVRFTIRAYLEAGFEPRTALRMTDLALGSSLGDDFATAVAATWDPATRRLIYSCAGHPKPIVVGADAPLEVDMLGSPPIGMGHTSGSRQTTFALEAGAEFWLFSDGLTEAREPGDRPLGRDALRKRLSRRPDPESLLEALPGIESTTRDDLTAVRVRPPDGKEDFQPFSVEALLVEQTHGDAAVRDFLTACGLEGDDLDQCCDRIAAERRHEGQVLVRVSRLDDALHWRVERVDPQVTATVPAVPGPGAGVTS